MESCDSHSHVPPRTGCRCTDARRYYDCPCWSYLDNDDRHFDGSPLGGCHRNPVGVPYDLSCWSCHLPDGSCRWCRLESYRNYDYSSNNFLYSSCHYLVVTIIPWGIIAGMCLCDYPCGGYRLVDDCRYRDARHSDVDCRRHDDYRCFDDRRIDVAYRH